MNKKGIEVIESESYQIGNLNGTISYQTNSSSPRGSASGACFDQNNEKIMTTAVSIWLGMIQYPTVVVITYVPPNCSSDL